MGNPFIVPDPTGQYAGSGSLAGGLTGLPSDITPTTLSSFYGDGGGGGESFDDAMARLIAQGWDPDEAFYYLTTGQPFPPDSGGGGGYGGGGGGFVAGPDHFFDVNPLDQAKFDYQKEQDGIQNELIRSQQELERLVAERDYALKVGDQNLARQRNSDINHWEEVNSNLQVRAQDVTMRGQALDFASQMASIEAQKNASRMQYQVGMANASNDAEANQVQDKWNQQQAHLAIMEDNTRKQIAGLNAQIDQFGKETERMVGLGGLGIEHNKFILEAASQPSNMFSMFMMQRGMAPDFETLIGGGQVAQGKALAPVDPFSLYTPKVSAVTDFSLPESNAPIVSGSVAQGAAGNRFIQDASAVEAQGSDPQGVAQKYLDYFGAGKPIAAPTIGKPDQVPEQVPGQSVPRRSGSGVAIANLTKGQLNQATVDGDVLGSDFTLPAYYDQNKTRPVQRNDVVPHGTSVFVDVPAAAGGTDFMAGGWLAPNISRGISGSGYNPIDISMPGPGRDPYEAMPMPEPYPGPVTVGDDPQGIDASRKEIAVPMLDRFGRPAVSVQPLNPQGIMEQYKRRMQAFLGGFGGGGDWRSMMGGGTRELPVGAGGQVTPTPQAMQAMLDYSNALRQQKAMYDKAPINVQSSTNPADARRAAANYKYTMGDTLINRGRESGNTTARQYMSGWVPMPAAAGGTDTMQQYIDQGLGGFYIPDSANPGVDPNSLPPALKALHGLGFPIPPSLISQSTGQTTPTLNMQSVFNRRGLGTAPSLQSLRRNTASENEAFKGYVQSVGKIPFQDFIDWLGRPTQNLRSAAYASR